MRKALLGSALVLNKAYWFRKYRAMPPAKRPRRGPAATSAKRKISGGRLGGTKRGKVLGEEAADTDGEEEREGAVVVVETTGVVDLTLERGVGSNDAGESGGARVRRSARTRQGGGEGGGGVGSGGVGSGGGGGGGGSRSGSRSSQQPQQALPRKKSTKPPPRTRKGKGVKGGKAPAAIPYERMPGYRIDMDSAPWLRWAEVTRDAKSVLPTLVRRIEGEYVHPHRNE